MPILSLSFVAQRYRKSNTPKRFIHLPNKPSQQFSNTNPDTQRKNHALPPHYHLPPPTIPSTQPRHSHYPTAPFPLPNPTIPSTQPRHSLYPTAPTHLPIPTNPSTDPHHSIYRSPPLHLPTPPSHLPSHTSSSTELCFHPLTFAPFLRRDTIASAHLRPSFSALVPSLLCTNAPTVAHHRALSYQGGGVVVRWERSVCPIQTSRCSDAIRGDVRRYRGKVYRVSEKSL